MCLHFAELTTTASSSRSGASCKSRALVGRLFYDARCPALYPLVERLALADGGSFRVQLALAPVPVALHELEPRLLFTLLIVT